MNKLIVYRQAVRKIIEEYASYNPSHGQIETEAALRQLQSVKSPLENMLGQNNFTKLFKFSKVAVGLTVSGSIKGSASSNLLYPLYS
jgi:hypothetical protein